MGFSFTENIGQGLILANFVLFINSDWGKALWQEHVLQRFTTAQIQTWGTYVVGFGITWIMYAAFFVIDMSQKPASITNTKVQPAVPVTYAMYQKALPRVLFNSVILNACLAYAGSFSPLQLKVSVDEFPSTAIFLRDIAGCGLITEFGFYGAHYLFHHPSIYKHFHKIHHEFTAPMAIASTYAHPLEHVVANVLPIAVGPFILRSHILVAFCFTIMGIINTACVHSGYLVPGFEPSLAHDYHHMKFNFCYGTSLGICDWLFGTTPTDAELESQYHARMAKVSKKTE
ncbi:Chromosome 5 4 [Chytriomyces hyalinus]|nr:Chromosome 5 4 [Chytriomyces hyalinus]